MRGLTRRGVLAVGLLGCVSFLATPGPSSSQPKKQDLKTAEANLRKAQEAVKNTDATLQLLSKALYVGSVLTKNPDLKEASKFANDLRKPASELKKHTDKIVDLVERQKDKKAAEKESKTLLEKTKLVRIKYQVDELDRLAKKVRELPVGLVSEKVDGKFAVSAELLVKNPAEAQARFKAYLAALETNASYLKSKQEQLEEAGKLGDALGRFLGEVERETARATPYSGAYRNALAGFCLDTANLGKAYSGLGTDCLAKAKEAKRAAEVERRRHDNLKTTLATVFGFRL